MLPALVVAIQWTGSLAVASGFWVAVMKAVDVVVNKAVDSLEDASSSNKQF
jgi:hypothetical protein